MLTQTLQVKPMTTCGFCGLRDLSEIAEQQVLKDGTVAHPLRVAYLACHPYAVCPRCHQQVGRSTWKNRSWRTKWRRETRKKCPDLQEFCVVVSFLVSTLDGQKYVPEVIEQELRQLLVRDKILVAVDVEHVTEVA